MEKEINTTWDILTNLPPDKRTCTTCRNHDVETMKFSEICDKCIYIECKEFNNISIPSKWKKRTSNT